MNQTYAFPVDPYIMSESNSPSTLDASQHDQPPSSSAPAALQAPPPPPAASGPDPATAFSQMMGLSAPRRSEYINGIKVKRPVGRPRKDGLPAGSVPGPKRPPRPPGSKPPGRPRKVRTESQIAPASQFSMTYSPSAPPAGATNRQWNMFAPVYQGGFPPTLASVTEDWSALMRTDNNAFLRDLLSAIAAQSPVYITGMPIEDAFKSQLSALSTKHSGEDNSGIPVLYSVSKTFWLPSSSPYFSLTSSASSSRIPSEHRFFYWDPLPLVFNGIACPGCSTPLINRGRIRSAPVKIFDLNKPFYIIGCEYLCRSAQCTQNGAIDARKFASTDTSILRILPIALQSEFPAQLLVGPPENNKGDLGSGPNVWNWQALGVSVSLYTLVKSCIFGGMPKQVILEVLRGIRDALPEFPMSGLNGAEEEEEDDGEGGGASGGEVLKATEGGQPVAAESEPSVSARPQSTLFNAWRAPIPTYRSESAAAAGGEEANKEAQPEAAAGEDNAEGSGAPPAPSVSAPGTPANANGPSFGGYSTLAPQNLKRPFSAIADSDPTPTITSAAAALASAPYSSGPGHAGSPFPLYGSAPYNTNGGADGEGMAGTSVEQQMLMSKRRPRHCLKCGSAECKGKGGRTLCTNACQDCGKMDCPGRRRPHKTCAESGWPE